jgi:3-methyl-2-oxobutanoate hydroxymethyltransferase
LPTGDYSARILIRARQVGIILISYKSNDGLYHIRLEGTMSTIEHTHSLTTRKKTTIRTLLAMKQQDKPITMLTAYDYPTAQVMDHAGIDVILVGDSLGMVVLGYQNTLPVTMEDMLHHCKAVARGAPNTLLIGDMPFMSYQVSIEMAVYNAGRFLQEAGMDAVKLEGGRERLEAVRAIVSAGIPVMGHIGLTPQSIHQLGGFRVQGRSASAAHHLLEDALLLEDAGCFSIVLESMPARLAQLITEKLSIPTIGIGAGSACDGQVLVVHDLLGLFDRFVPSFARQYANISAEMGRAFSAYIKDVSQRSFPGKEHAIDMADEEWEELKRMI